jgi:hypothetical protein
MRGQGDNSEDLNFRNFTQVLLPFGYFEKSAQNFWMRIYKISPLTTLKKEDKIIGGYRQKKNNIVLIGTRIESSLVLLAYQKQTP